MDNTKNYFKAEHDYASDYFLDTPFSDKHVGDLSDTDREMTMYHQDNRR